MPSPRADALTERDPGGFLGEAALTLYGAAGVLGTPIADAVLKRRARNGKEDIAHSGERWGFAGARRPQGPLVWVHSASVGETNGVLPLVERLAARGPTLLLTTGTVTAAEVARPRLPPGAIHQFVPIDTPGAVRRFLDHWRPDLALFAESELWPTMLKELRRRSLPLVVVNARMSERSFRSWSRLAPLARAVLGRAELFLAQTPADAERLRTLGAERVIICGNLKFDVPPPIADPSKIEALRAAVAGRFVLVAASTHPGEEEVVIAAHKQLTAGGTPLLTIIAPRHPQRGEAVAALLEGAGLTSRRRSRGEEIDSAETYIADTIGEMGLWYALADVAFLGGSIMPHGGQNPIEPAKLGVPILHGSDAGNFLDIYRALDDAGAAAVVNDGKSFAAAVKGLASDPGEREKRAREARACISRFTGALDRTLVALDPYLARLSQSQ